MTESVKANLKRLTILTGLLLIPSLAHAHSAGGATNGWSEGFNHPLHGWDHLLAMLAVGIWAAQQRGQAVWLIPLTFVGVMMVGGIVGASGVRLPGVELAISLSVVVFVALVARGARFQVGVSAAIVGFFAFFHGFAHGSEMPGTASLVTFGLGFIIATLLLHGAGWVAARGVALALACAMSGTALAQQSTHSTAASSEANSEQPTRLPEIVVEGRADSLIGIADSATQGTVGARQLSDRPILRSGEILETVPGVIITQHAGGGKANQYFLRGFNLDHGTDFATFLDGMPLNLPTHGHGQGYSDMNCVIPELVQRVNYEKGIYYAENGDFSSAGAARLDFYKTLPQSFATIEGGMFGYARGVFASSPQVGEDGHLLYALEVYHDDGPWERADNYRKLNGQVTYSRGDDANGWSLTGRGYHGEWNSSDQVATSAVDTGLVPFYGSLDDSTGGKSRRYSLQGEWHRADENSATKIMAYGFFYDLDLFSDFTYFLTDTTLGDQFEQVDHRWVAGGDARHTFFGHLASHDMENTFGLQLRNDWIRNGLYQTADGQRVDKVDQNGNVLAATTRRDNVTETSAGIFWENKVQWAEKLRSTIGVRGDMVNNDVVSRLAANSGTETAFIGSPKASLVFGPWAKTEVYVQGGLGFHSNDGRGTTTTVDPMYPTNSVSRADPLVRTYGAEIGVRTLAVDGLQSTVSFWWLDADSELVFVGDAGTTEASRPSRRYGVEWANFYNITKRLTLDADFSFSHAEFRDSDTVGDHIPGAIESVIAAGLTYSSDSGFFGSVRLRYFGPRPLIENNSVRSGETILLNAQVGYHINQTWTISAEILNLLDRKDHDIDYYYESRVTPASAALEQIHFHPVEPIQARIALTARF